MTYRKDHSGQPGDESRDTEIQPAPLPCPRGSRGVPIEVRKAILEEMAQSPLLDQLRSSLTRKTNLLFNRQVAAYCHEMVQARKDRDPRKAEAVYREIKMLDDRHNRLLEFLRSDEFAERVAADWAEQCQKKLLGTGSDTNLPRKEPEEPGLFWPLTLSDEKIQYFAHKYVQTEITKRLKAATKKGGPRRIWDPLWSVIQEMDANPERVPDKKTANVYNQRYARSIKDGKLKKADADIVNRVRYERTKRKRPRSSQKR